MSSYIETGKHFLTEERSYDPQIIKLLGGEPEVVFKNKQVAREILDSYWGLDECARKTHVIYYYNSLGKIWLICRHSYNGEFRYNERKASTTGGWGKNVRIIKKLKN